MAILAGRLCRQARWHHAALGLLLMTFGLTGCHTAKLVELRPLIPGLVLDIRYATTNNFTGQQLYPHARCFLRHEPAQALAAVQVELAKSGMGLKIFDGYRPLSVQRRMWEVFPHADYVADPSKGSRHNRGAAVDVTLVHLADGKEAVMPTSYDDFTEKAHRNYQQLPAEAISNREFLATVMARHGFVGLPSEWWHFDFGDWKKYPLLDVDVPAAANQQEIRLPNRAR